MTYDVQQKEMNEVKAFLLSEKPVERYKFSFGEVYEIEIRFYVNICKSTPKSKESLKKWHLILHDSKPDVDNLVKFYMDAANGILFLDDKCVTRVKASKTYDANPRTEIEVKLEKNVKLEKYEEDVFSVFDPETFLRFSDDIQKIAKNISVIDGEGESFDREVWFRTTAGVLIEFAEKYSDKLRKIKVIK